jgi:hypothetical protein
LAIADPPYPPAIYRERTVPRASRWYGQNQQSATDRPADAHPDAAEWDDPARHRALMAELTDTYDGWALATPPDGLEVYRPLPPGAHVAVWVKLNSIPGPARIRSCWEAVIVYPARRSSRGIGVVPDVLVCGQGGRFAGAKPARWTRWILAMMGHDPTDTVADLFPGSGEVTAELNQGRLL